MKFQKVKGLRNRVNDSSQSIFGENRVKLFKTQKCWHHCFNHLIFLCPFSQLENFHWTKRLIQRWHVYSTYGWNAAQISLYSLFIGVFEMETERQGWLKQYFRLLKILNPEYELNFNFAHENKFLAHFPQTDFQMDVCFVLLAFLK